MFRFPTNEEMLLFYVLLYLIIIDFGTGLAKSIVWKVTDSSIGAKGITKHLFVIIVTLSLTIVTISLNEKTVNMAVNGFYISIYALSIVENLGVMGVPVPDFIKSRIKNEVEKYKELKGE